jgi:DNA-binding CsgD family transcriptional regulator
MALVDAVRGNEESCRRNVDEAVSIAARTNLGPLRLRAECLLGLLDLGLGRLDQAIDRLEGARREIVSLGLREREASPWPDLVEAYVRAGALDRAEQTLAEFEASRLQTSPVWPRAVAAACRGELAKGSFAPHFEEAVSLYSSIADPFAVARARLAFGERLRRDGRRSESREQLRAAMEAFDELGATPWGDRARAELRATGETARRRDVAASEELTPQELQVAAHVAEGKTNREVGAALYLSHKTVESHLARVYRKLGINSRAELIRLFATRPQDLGVPVA